MKKSWSGSLRKVTELWTKGSDEAETDMRGRGCLEVGGKYIHTHTLTVRSWRLAMLVPVIYQCGRTI